MSEPTQIPTIDLALPEPQVIRQLDAAFAAFGFCVCTNSGLSEAVMEAAFAASRDFHALPASEKAELAINRWHRGYIAPKSNTTLTSSVARVTRPNTSESLLVMHEVAHDDPRFGAPLQGPNQWPEGLPGFRPAVEAYRREVEALARRLAALALAALGAEPGLLAALFTPPTEFLRLLHYAPEPAGEAADSFGSAPHTDHGFLTLVVQDDTGGLEVQTRDGAWIPALPEAGAFVVNAADMLAHLSAGRWRSSPHRVKNRKGRDRYSIAYFFDPAMDAVITPLAHLTKKGTFNISGNVECPLFCGPVAYGDYILSKFDANYGYRQPPP